MNGDAFIMIVCAACLLALCIGWAIVELAR